MNRRRIFGKSVVVLSYILLFLFSNKAIAADGKALFNSQCASCHAVHKNSTGPALAGLEDRWGNRDDLYVWINNWEAAVAKGIPQAQKIQSYSSTAMNKFNFKKDEMDAIIDYINSVPDPKAATQTVGNENGEEGAKKADNSLLYGVLSAILLVIALTLLYVNSNLRRVADDKEGIVSPQPVPFFRNKMYLGIFAIVAFLLTGYNLGKAGMAMGRSKDYQPEQPIYYSHKVHAGINQINCLYCHTGAQEGKQATIPTVNVCMNCHQNIKEYTGPKMFREDGSEVNGTAEIKKLWEYAGYSGNDVWNPNTAKSKPIPWVKIHNLPDHVYFNHSQHVKVGEQNCQTCHGEIQEMGEVKQVSDLSMGWCVNCHRETGVNYKVDPKSGKASGNMYYQQYEKLHHELKNSKKEKITVENIGGTECQKCHY
jgi:cytochrome c2